MNRRNIFTSSAAALLSALGLVWSTKDATAATRGQLEVRFVKGMGRGVFARAPIRAGTTVIRDYTIAIPAEDKDHAAQTIFDDYFFVAEDPSAEEAVGFLALGLASLLNHSAKAPNVEQEWNLTKYPSHIPLSCR